jgi:hypothetical protein
MVQNNYDKLIKELALKNNIDVRVCKEIVNSPFAYLKHLVTSATVEDGVRLPYVGAFCQKGNYKNKGMRAEKRKDILLSEILEVTIMMATTLGFIVPSVDSAKELIEKAWDTGDYEKIDLIWHGWLEYNK